MTGDDRTWIGARVEANKWKQKKIGKKWEKGWCYTDFFGGDAGSQGREMQTVEETIF